MTTAMQTMQSAPCSILNEARHIGLLGLMLTSSSEWVIRPWLYRHIAIFDRLAILDGSKAGSPAAAWTAAQCKLYANCVYANEADVYNSQIQGWKTDQTIRAAATQVLLCGAKTQVLEGRWIYIAHPDEFLVQDLRILVSQVERVSPLANVIEFKMLYALPSSGERSRIREFEATSNGYQSFEPIVSLASCDAGYIWHEARLFRWETGAEWGQSRSKTGIIPEKGPSNGWKYWPANAHFDRTTRHSLAPHIVHFKVHDFAPGAFRVEKSKNKGRPWISFTRSGLHTGMGTHRTQKFRIDWNQSAEDQIFGFYNRTGHRATPVATELQARCNATGLELRCSVEWKPQARFSTSAPTKKVAAGDTI